VEAHKGLIRQMCGGFTLIELLVVISIIALLTAILIPALSAVRKHATGAACLGNEQNLIVAWVMYTDDNDSKLVGGYPYVRDIHKSGSPYPDRTQWLCAPLAEDGTTFPAGASNSSAYMDACLATPPTKEQVDRGIRAGALYPYLNTLKVYHCPGDKRWTMEPPPLNVYQSYSVSDPMNGKFEDAKYAYRKIVEIKTPAAKYVFVEEAARNASFNIGSWWFGYKWNTGRIEDSAFIDPVALWHGDKNTFAFADGHAEVHKWQVPSTVKALKQYLDGKGFPLNRTSGLPEAAASGNQDILWLAQHYY
jgi:prepilin-type N-terminal cleavage/methylation domain-containing protein/prepilin-type processing-associated H-X9-DG protein